jgi:hypothetical protein
MARYIDADRLLFDLHNDVLFDKNKRAIETVHNQPTAEVAEVRHGKWIDRDGKTWCSLCGESNKQYKPPYCPHCGTRMDGDEDDKMR